MPKTKFFHYVIFTALTGSLIFSQVNTEAMRNIKEGRGFSNTLGFDFGFEKSKEEVLEIAGKYRLDFLGKNGLTSFLVLSYENGYEKEDNKKNSIVNKGFGHLRFTKNISDNFFIEVFTQYGFNDFLLMKERRLFGSGIRYMVLNQEILSGYVGVGAMQEDEIYNLGSDINMNLIRSTNYLSWKIKFSENSSIQNTAYYQFDSKNASDRRILYDGDLNIALNSKLAFTLSLNFRYDSDPHGELGKTYTQLKNGIEYIF
tara:strand:+ start:275 stop:1048 length:774 start_codon:yes stop_codon:yes gene_type:complete